MSKIKVVRIAMAAVIIPLVMISCKINVSYDADKIRKTDFDDIVIPDKYNTGTKTGTIFNKISGSGFIAENVFLTFRSDMNPPAYMITSYGDKNREKLPSKSIIRDYDFSDYSFIIAGSDRYPGNRRIVFENCKFKGFRNDAASPDASRVYITFNNCSFEGGVNSSYITLNNCKIGGFTADGMNPLREFYANNVYVYDLFHEAISNIVHVDGIQIYGDQRSRNNVVNEKWVSKVETGEIHFKNIRFEIPSIHFDGMASGTGVNACVMFQLEFSDVDNVSFERLYVNGGGKWFPLYMDHGKNNERSAYGEWSHKNLSMKYVMVSDNFGKIFYPNYLNDADVVNVDHHSMLLVSSVWKSEDGKAHVIVSNDTKADKKLVVKSDAGIFEFVIPHCPSNWALGGELNSQVKTEEGLADETGRSYMTYRWQDMPFDLDLEIPGNPKFVVCYQGDEQIRYVSFDGRNHYFSEIISSNSGQ